MLDILPDPSWIVSSGGEMTFSNKAWCDYLGGKSDRADWLKRVHPDDAPLTRSSWTASLRSGEPLRACCRLRGSNGNVRWFAVQARQLPPPRPRGQWLFAAHDVHDLISRERMLEERLRIQVAMLDMTIDCVKVITPDGCLSNINKAGRVALGVPETSSYGMDWLSLLPEEIRAGGCVALDVARKGENSRFDGCSQLPSEAKRYWDNSLTPVLNADGRTEVILCLSRDVTLQRSIEEQLRLANRNLEASFNARTEELERLWSTSQDLLLVISQTGIILRANPAWQSVLGYEVGELIGADIRAFIAPHGEAAAQQALANAAVGSLQNVEICHLHKDGSPRWISWIATPSDEEIYASGRHVTAIREAERKLRLAEEALHHAQKVEAIGRLTGSVAHDFNNLLAIIHDSLIILRVPNLPSERRSRCLEVMTKTTEQAITVTRQLLDFARRSPCNPSVFDVSRSIASLLDMLNMLVGRAIDIHVEVGPDACIVLADPSQFDTALVNVAMNARDAMEGKGALWISARPVSLARATWRHRDEAGDFIAISIADTGPGIPEEHIDRIFEPFFTTKKVGVGTGLGLPQVVGFAEQSGGTVGVANTPGSGVTLTIYLPRVRAPEAGPSCNSITGKR
jgi:PAS domain S-box-containing protein